MPSKFTKTSPKIFSNRGARARCAGPGSAFAFSRTHTNERERESERAGTDLDEAQPSLAPPKKSHKKENKERRKVEEESKFIKRLSIRWKQF